MSRRIGRVRRYVDRQWERGTSRLCDHDNAAGLRTADYESGAAFATEYSDQRYPFPVSLRTNVQTCIAEDVIALLSGHGRP